jgi:hypothetical protein
MGSQLSISDLIRSIRDKDLVLPEFQRGYVWSKEQVKGYLDSLYRGYPTGSFLIWKTPNPGLIRGKVDNDTGAFELILDGQQRLTSIYALVQGKAPPFYEGEKLYFDLCFNVRTEEFSYYKKMQMAGQVEWLRVTPFFQMGLGGYLGPSGPCSEEDRKFLWEFLPRLTQLDKVRDYTYYLDTLTEKEMETVVRIFNLVNSKGTPLTKADLALSHICALWPEARQQMRDFRVGLASGGYDFDLNFFVRCLSAVATGSGRFEPIYSAPIEKIQDAWKLTQKSLAYLANVLRADAFMESSANFTSQMVIVPLVVYLSRNGCHFPDERTKRELLHWMYAALMWARYTGSPETKLTQDLDTLSDERPADRLRANIIAERGRIRVEGRDLSRASVSTAWSSILYVVAKAHGARDWFNGLPVKGELLGSSNAVEHHHIFPQNLLYAPKGPYDSRFPDHKQLVNEIANLAFITAGTNKSVGNKPPSVYLPAVQKKYPGALTQQSVPEAPALWDVSRYEDFLVERRERLAEAINSFMERLLEAGERPAMTIADYIAAGESETVEFKMSLRWDHVQCIPNKLLEKVVARTLAGFMNAAGGTLVVGVTDEGEVCGLDADLSTFGAEHRDLDQWEQHLRNVLNNYVGKEQCVLVDGSFADVDGKTVAVLHVDRQLRPVFLTDGGTSEFHVRSGNTTQLLNVQQANTYIQVHFPVLA